MNDNFEINTSISILLIRYYNILAKEMYIVAGVVNTTDPMAIIKNISHVVYHPDFKTPVVSSEDYSGETTDSSSTIINDLALVKASILTQLINLFLLKCMPHL